jgi:hypothetical protein
MREDAWDIADCGLRIADCLPSVAVAKEGGFPPPLKHRRTGRIADLTAKNAARKAATEVIAPRISQGHFGGTPKWAGESPALPLTFSVFGFFVVKEFFVGLGIADLRSGDNGDSAALCRAPLRFQCRLPGKITHIGVPGHPYTTYCGWSLRRTGKAQSQFAIGMVEFTRLRPAAPGILRLFAANQHNLLTINNLQLAPGLASQGQSRLIKANRVISCDWKRQTYVEWKGKPC